MRARVLYTIVERVYERSMAASRMAVHGIHDLYLQGGYAILLVESRSLLTTEAIRHTCWAAPRERMPQMYA